MSDMQPLPELKEIVGAMLFVSQHPLTLADIRRVLVQVGERQGGAARTYAGTTEAEIAAAVQQLKTDLIQHRLGLEIREVANGFRLENHPGCGTWLRHLLDKGRPARLSRPALETLAIIAYRQPCTRADIEKVRGVAVDQVVRHLLELGLIRIVRRSELPGRPWLFGTTQKFLEHFGLRNLDDLPSVQELRRLEAEQISRAARVESDAVRNESDLGNPADARENPPEQSGEGFEEGASQDGQEEGKGKRGELG